MDTSGAGDYNYKSGSIGTDPKEYICQPTELCIAHYLEHNSFQKQVCVKYNIAYLVEEESDSPNKYSDTDICFH